MKRETKIKKLTLNKETLRDLTAQNAGEVKGGAKGANTKKLTCACKCTYIATGCLMTGVNCYPYSRVC
jgi:hypothetical protein